MCGKNSKFRGLNWFLLNTALTRKIERDKSPRCLFCALIAQKQSPLRFAPHFWRYIPRSVFVAVEV